MIFMYCSIHMMFQNSKTYHHCFVMICFNTWPFKWREQETLFDRPSEQEQAEAEMRRLRSKQEPQVPSCNWKHTKSAEGWRRQRQLYSATRCQDERSAMIKQRVEEGVKRCLYCWSLFRWESAKILFESFCSCFGQSCCPESQYIPIWTLILWKRWARPVPFCNFARLMEDFESKLKEQDIQQIWTMQSLSHS